MADMAIPPPPQALPSSPRVTRRLQSGVVVTVFVGVLIAMVGAAWYGFALISSQHQQKAASEPTAKDQDRKSVV